MSTDVTLPALGESVTEGTVTRWLKAVGDTVAVDEPLLEVSTDKVDTEIPAPAGGVLLEILVGEDETVEVGTVVAASARRPRRAPAAPAPAAAAARRRGSPLPEAPVAAAPVAEAPAAAAPVAAARPLPSRSCSRTARGGARRPRAACRCSSGDATDVLLPALGRVRDGGHRHAVAQGRRRHDRRGRAPARSVDRQGRHRDPCPRGGHAARDPGGRGRDRRGRHRAWRASAQVRLPRRPLPPLPRAARATAAAPEPAAAGPRQHLLPLRHLPRRPLRHPLPRHPRGSRSAAPPAPVRLPRAPSAGPHPATSPRSCASSRPNVASTSPP